MAKGMARVRGESVASLRDRDTDRDRQTETETDRQTDRARGESVAAFLDKAAARERDAVLHALSYTAGEVGCAVSREVLRCVPTTALNALVAALVKAEDVVPGADTGMLAKTALCTAL